jgi:hypothetical protein
VPWPPEVGELLPRFDEAIGIAEKLRTYSFDLDHEDGGAKAKGFLVMLGLDIHSIDYVEQEIRLGISQTPIQTVRSNGAFGYQCAVQFRIAGTESYSHRTADIRTVWALVASDARPRMITAFLR